jgi:hypothetical protein
VSQRAANKTDCAGKSLSKFAISQRTQNGFAGSGAPEVKILLDALIRLADTAAQRENCRGGKDAILEPA